MIFRKIKHNSPNGALFRKIVVKIQIHEALTEGIFAVVIEVTIEDLEEIAGILNDLSWKIKTKILFCHEINRTKIFLNKI